MKCNGMPTNLEKQSKIVFIRFKHIQTEHFYIPYRNTEQIAGQIHVYIICMEPTNITNNPFKTLNIFAAPFIDKHFNSTFLIARVIKLTNGAPLLKLCLKRQQFSKLFSAATSFQTKTALY